MSILCQVENAKYTITELSQLLCETYDSGIMIKSDRDFYVQLVNYVERALIIYKGYILHLPLEIKTCANFLRQIAFLYHKHSSKWNDDTVYLAMLKSIAFTHKIDPRDYEIVKKIKNDYFSLNSKDHDERVHIQIRLFTLDVYKKFLSK
jgi:hypothetical protein